MVNHPPHYNFGTIEVIDLIEKFNLGFHLGNAFKYILRANHKSNYFQDLAKAEWYLQRFITNEVNNARFSESRVAYYTLDSLWDGFTCSVNSFEGRCLTLLYLYCSVPKVEQLPILDGLLEVIQFELSKETKSNGTTY